jgi:hypothetical protein
MYGERLNQVDFRLTKVFQVGRTRLQAMADLYNLFNASTVLAVNNSHGSAWQRPLQILQARLFKAAVQVDF